MGRATAAGFNTVLSSPYYLNVINQGSNFHEDWPFYYSVEPTSFEAPDGQLLSEEQKETAVTGVEACMCSECVATTLPFACGRAGLSGGAACVRRWVDGSNFAGRFWPRAAAIAERGWSPKATTGIDAACTRFLNEPRRTPT